MVLTIDSYEDGDEPMPTQTDDIDEDGGREHDVLIRCTKGDTKFSSRVRLRIFPASPCILLIISSKTNSLVRIGRC